jgi:hypothetical protein
MRHLSVARLVLLWLHGAAVVATGYGLNAKLGQSVREVGSHRNS